MKKLREKILYSGKWLALKETTFQNKKGEEVKWESIKRTNTNRSVVIVAKLIPSARYILIKQFRHAINNYVIGFPAGLIEVESVRSEAARELLEETGYKGTVTEIGPELVVNAAVMTDTVTIVTMEVEENLEENKNPKQRLEAAEEIDIILMEKDKIKEYLKEESKKGCNVGLGPWYIFGVLK